MSSHLMKHDSSCDPSPLPLRQLLLHYSVALSLLAGVNIYAESSDVRRCKYFPYYDSIRPADIFSCHTVRPAAVLPTVKGKAIPLKAWTGPAGFRRLPGFETIGTRRW